MNESITDVIADILKGNKLSELKNFKRDVYKDKDDEDVEPIYFDYKNKRYCLTVNEKTISNIKF